MGSAADRTIDALNSGYRELVALLDTLSPEQLRQTSGAAEWTVAQVLSHLGSGSEIGLAGLDATLEGTGPKGQEFNQSVWARWDAMTPDEQAAGFRAANRKLLDRLDELDEATRESVRFDLGFLPQPVDLATAYGLRLNEFALHSWDVRVAFDPQATLAPESVELLLEFIGMLFGFLGKPQNIDGPARLAVRLTDPDRSFGLVLDESATVTDVPADPDGTLTAPAEFWLRLITGRHAPEHTPASVTLTGDKVSLDDLRKVFPGF